MKSRRFAVIAVFMLLLGVLVSACGESPAQSARQQANELGEKFVPYVPPPGSKVTEQINYNEAQKLYNDPTTILWCTVYPQSNTSPIITVPVRGKLTSSSTTAFQPEGGVEIPGSDNGGVGTSRSVDGLYHPNPPGYRYGFTPGNQYVDFYNLPTFCTTQPLEFQKQSVQVDVDQGLNEATKKASEALEQGNAQEAQAILREAAGS